jgi:hypothetical protein
MPDIFEDMGVTPEAVRALHMYFLLTGAYASRDAQVEQASTVRAIILSAPRPQHPKLPQPVARRI